MGNDGGKDVHEGMGDILVALQKHFAPMSEVVRSQYEPNAEAELNLTKKYSPKFAEAQYENMSTWGRKLAELGRDLSKEEQLGAAKTEADVAEGPGRRLSQAARDLQMQQDPEYYAQRERQSAALDKLESLTDPSTLTPGEQEEIARGLGRTMSTVPSAQNTTRAAMSFGDRLAKKRAEYRDLINTRTQAMPALRSGIEGFAAATKRSVTPNVGLAGYTGLQTPGQQQSNSVFGQFMQPASNAMAINMGKQTSDWENYMSGVNAVGKTLGTVGQVAGAFSGMCWVARAAFGEYDPRWKQFRGWLTLRAPVWLINAYKKYGPEFAECVKTSPLLAKIIRGLMMLAIKN